MADQIETQNIDPQLKTKLTEIGDCCTSLTLRKAARAVSHIMDSYVRTSGLRSGQFGILVAIANRGKVTVTDLADALLMDVTTLSRNIRLLERDGFVTIASGSDKRVREIMLTKLGVEKLEVVIPLWGQAQQSIKNELGGTEWSTLISLLHKVHGLPTGQSD